MDGFTEPSPIFSKVPRQTHLLVAIKSGHKHDYPLRHHGDLTKEFLIARTSCLGDDSETLDIVFGWSEQYKEIKMVVVPSHNKPRYPSTPHYQKAHYEPRLDCFHYSIAESVPKRWETLAPWL